MSHRSLHGQIGIALCLGVLIGMLGRAIGLEPLLAPVVGVAGSLFLRALRMIAVPLIAVSITEAVSSLSAGHSFGRLGLKTALYYCSTSLLAIFTGLVLVNIVQPGVGAGPGLLGGAVTPAAGGAGPADLVTGIVPENLFAALAQGDMLAIVFCALLAGWAVTRTPPAAHQRLNRALRDVGAVMRVLAGAVIRCAPVGVFALLADITLRSGIDAFTPLLRYTATVAAGLGVHALVTLPAAVVLLGGARPLHLARGVSGALMTAFSTSSSAATLPVTMQAVRENTSVPDDVSAFVLPLGATVNMDGTALYECVAAVFIAQACGIELSAGQQAVIMLTALGASVGAAGIPMAGMVMMTIVLRSVGLPLEGVGLVLAVDRVLDMLRTTVNVWSDTCGVVVIAATEPRARESGRAGPE